MEAAASCTWSRYSFIHSFPAQQQRPSPVLIVLQLFRSRSMVIVAKEFNIRCISCKLLSFVPVMEFGNKCREEKNILASFGNLLQGLLFLVVLFRSWSMVTIFCASGLKKLTHLGFLQVSKLPSCDEVWNRCILTSFAVCCKAHYCLHSCV